MTFAQRFAPLLICVLAHESGYAAPESHFRGFKWYETLETVRATETASFVELRTNEMNVAVSPPVPWKVEHLYYRDVLDGKPVLVLYRFDLECKQLYEGNYIFERQLDDQDILKLVSALEDKYKVKLSVRSFGDEFHVSGLINDRTAVEIYKEGLLHFFTNNTVVSFHTTNWAWIGWREGTEPKCNDKNQSHEALKKKL